MTDAPFPNIPPGLHPIVVIEDRYTGVYSEGAWIAVANALRPASDVDTFDPGVNYRNPTRADFVLNDGPSLEDPQAMKFWSMAPDWIAVGDSPDAAVRNLLEKVVAD